ncbi:MAG TPA: DUF3788 family protein [Treponemataceae bacterium]|nr:DUF3788 family protein [Treponemataceae bacterium]
MDTINTIELTNESVYPDEKVLKDVLGDSYSAYCELLQVFDSKKMEREWRYYKDGKAWLCKVQYKKKTIVWMSAWKGYMQATVYVMDRHLEGLLGLEISEKTKERIMNTKNVGKSKPCIFEVKKTDILTDVEKVIDYKISAK